MQLRKIREQRGLTLEEAASRVMMSKSALSRIENAQVVARPHEVNYILMSYGYEEGDDLRSALVGLAPGGRSRDWIRRHKLPGKGPNYGEYVLLEQDSSELFAYHADLVPGLLQTPEYAHAVMSSVPSSGLSNIEEGVAYRMARKEALTRSDPLSIRAVVGEAAVCQWMGGREVMIAQLRYLLELIERPNIELRILPFTATKHPGVDGSFAILHVEAGDFPVVVVDALRRRIFIDDDEGVAAYRRVQDELCCLSLGKAETGERLERALRDLCTDASERINE
ncbi:Helix-turn-helix domain-containing protein [Actinomadura madurae]|uniref:Helix-turn-helix domain-containing protein n=1 Tax=Actinomadura madurae TaxID=1993 RepID=A0A1I5X473_9ACTN|nr:helix-turn-helix transcriptional regulator [Actinomadura madurae]SFQ26812.1 Helix-turn-helix domain-containing protein [Actinomadura madurae]SPT60798.1 Helix-turn-helix [Actinomadura madurae]